MTHASRAAPDCHDTFDANKIQTMTGKSGRGTARQTFRYDGEKWNKFGVAAEAAGSDRSSMLRDLIDWVMGDPDAPAPRRLVQPPLKKVSAKRATPVKKARKT